MAKFKYSQNIEDALDDLEGDLMLHVKPDGRKAVWVDDVSGARIVYEGRNLAASTTDPDMLGGGRITSIEMIDPNGKPVASITEFQIKATDLMAAYESGGSAGIALYLAQGDDRVIVSKEGDLLIAGAGDDEMTGKAGSDLFEFQALVLDGRNARPVEAERDVITDFDTRGADADELGLHQDFTYRGCHHGDDTLLTFEDGSTLLLEGVKKAAFEHYYE
jgi:hypothetical protein